MMAVRSEEQPLGGSVPRHLHAVDVVRLVTVGAVIAVHATSLTMPADDVAAGAVLVLLHVTREDFLFLSAFVLAYSYRARPLRTRSFWRRRYPLVLAPYVAWTAVYLVADGSVGSPVTTTARFATALAEGTARYHLYFLLITLQMYAVFPLVMRLIRRMNDRHAMLLGGSVVAQLALVALIHYRPELPVPGSWLPAYQLYVVGGVLAGLHFEAVTEWVRSHRRVVALGAAAAAICGLASYWIDVRVMGMTPVRASEVFQPAVVVESIAFVVALYAAGLWLAERAGTRRRRQLEASSDVSFGVFLAHPLLLQGIAAAATATGLATIWSSLPSGVALGLVLITLVPVTYLMTAVAVTLVRRTPASVALTGRHARAPAGTVRFNAAPTDEPIGAVS